MSDVVSIISDSDKLAFVEAFLLGLARRLDDASIGWTSCYVAADDCRAVARMVSRVGLTMERKDCPMPPAPQTFPEKKFLSK